MGDDKQYSQYTPQCCCDRGFVYRSSGLGHKIHEVHASVPLGGDLSKSNGECNTDLYHWNVGESPPRYAVDQVWNQEMWAALGMTGTPTSLSERS